MKKIGLICATVLIGMSLTACGSQSSSNKASKSIKTSSSKVVKHHKKQVKKEGSSSSNSVSSSSNNAVNSGSQQIQDSQQSSSNQSQQVQQNKPQSTQQSNNNGLPPASDLHDFVNRYGESPAAYLSEHNGMSPEQAVQSVPDTMKTSGEIQDTYQIQQGQDPFN
ncbi:hypothetical protein LTY36_04845 [Limosilactobacillus agrestis]|uniref:Lipoprotein n=1 Tax=Limosilactobacillus agrestis TaxID=2759748 RepID=A0ABS8R6V8_9LACO|nr:hypothetical protein [Limosilactobacillus agrestis]MCD7130517.1 hypothetical protein [Limosilactobacillus agrestis]